MPSILAEDWPTSGLQGDIVSTLCRRMFEALSYLNHVFCKRCTAQNCCHTFRSTIDDMNHVWRQAISRSSLWTSNDLPASGTTCRPTVAWSIPGMCCMFGYMSSAQRCSWFVARIHAIPYLHKHSPRLNSGRIMAGVLIILSPSNHQQRGWWEAMVIMITYCYVCVLCGYT